MDFYPVYRICRLTGTFTRIGSLLESNRDRCVKFMPPLLTQARTLFARTPGDTILLGPRRSNSGRPGVSVPGKAAHSGAMLARGGGVT